MKKITSPSGVSRIDEYDLATGYLKSQTLTDGKQTQILNSGYQYYPGGKIKSYVDQFGGTYTYDLDGFGRAVTVTNPRGVKTQKSLDGLDRETARITSFGNKALSREEFVYSKEQQKLEVEKVWQISGNQSKVLEKSRYLYDAAGNLIGKRGVRKDSWQYFLIDGCGNTVAAVDPEGDISVKLLRFGKPVYTASFMKGKNQTLFTGMLLAYDFAGRLIKNTPVNSNKKPADA
ncbi:MAG: hypothetical protein J5858_08645, partial [Lentisphaeria bacterium]|nr:hypothetical protein [Lentisphaeria bacterium]